MYAYRCACRIAAPYLGRIRESRTDLFPNAIGERSRTVLVDRPNDLMLLQALHMHALAPVLFRAVQLPAVAHSTIGSGAALQPKLLPRS